jgi:Peptidase family M48
MRSLWRGGLVCLSIGLAGCVADGAGRGPFAFRNPFAAEQRFDPAAAPAASAQAATRVHTVGSAVVAANATDLPSKPTFLTIGLKEPMVFHHGTDLVVLSEGLVDRCASDAELSAVVCHELGKIAAERGTHGTPRSERDLPPAAPGPADVVGAGHSADMTRVAEEAMFDRRGPRPKRGAREPRSDPKTLAQSFYTRAGHPSESFDRIAALVREAEDNADQREIMKGR